MNLRNAALFLISWLVLAGLGDLQPRAGTLSAVVGKVTFVRGKAVFRSDAEEKSIVTGDLVRANDILTTDDGAKVKVLLDENKILISILPGTTARVNATGAEVIKGAKENISITRLEFLRPDPKLDSRSQQIGGAFTVRSFKTVPEILSLKDTFCRETRPCFQWKYPETADFLVSLHLTKSDGSSQFLWNRRTSSQSLPFPPEEPALEPGRTYSWEVSVISSSDVRAAPAGFYILSDEECRACEREEALLDNMSKEDNTDRNTLRFLKAELLKKYHLKDELSALIEEPE